MPCEKEEEQTQSAEEFGSTIRTFFIQAFIYLKQHLSHDLFI